MTVNKSQYYALNKIAGEKHNIQYMFDREADITNFEYSEETVDNISNMDLFFYTGNGFEPWINGFIDKLKKGNLGIINLSRGMRAQTIQEGDKTIDNPYYWLGKEGYKIALYNAKAAIQDRDPKNRQYYEENYNKAVKEFDDAMKEYEDKLANIQGYSVITTGSSFDYFLKSLRIESIKAENNIDDTIKNNNLDLNKIIIIKDSSTILQSKHQFKYVVTLEDFDANRGYDDLIFSNIEELIKLNLEKIK